MNKLFYCKNIFTASLIISILLSIIYSCGPSDEIQNNAEESNSKKVDHISENVNFGISFTLQAAVKSSNPDTTINLLSEDIFSFTITDRTTGNKTALAVDSTGKARMFYAQKTGAFDISLILAGDESGKGKGIKADTMIVIRENDPKELSPQIVIRPKNKSEIKIIENLLVKRGIGVGSSMIDKPGS